MDNTSYNLEIEYMKGMINLLFLNIDNETIYVRESTSRQHKFKPCPPTG